jgi:protein-L-isoaspartate(D-aspartate) O-methyltransferase
MEFLLSLRRRGISDQAVLRAIDAGAARGNSCCRIFRQRRTPDQAMPIACGQTISQPYVVAYMTEQLSVTREHPRARGRHRLGYQAAILAQLAGQVITGRALPHACRRPPARCWPSWATTMSW